jgi:hypothetical protein
VCTRPSLEVVCGQDKEEEEEEEKEERMEQ